MTGWGHVAGWGWMGGGALLLVVLVVAGLVLLLRPGQRIPPEPAPRSPREVLADRLARGEIGEDEYRSRLSALGAGGPPPPRG